MKSRYKGCAYFCEGCADFPITESNRQDLCEQIRAGRKRLNITCPFPETVKKVQKATSKKNTPVTPKVALMEIEFLDDGDKRPNDAQKCTIGIRRFVQVIAAANPYIPEFGKYFWKRRNKKDSKLLPAMSGREFRAMVA